MLRKLVAIGTMIGAATLAPAAAAQTIEKRVRIGMAAQSDTRDTPAAGGKARIAMLTGTGDQLGLGLARSRQSASRSVSAVLGLWGDTHSLEFGGFQDRSAAGASRTVHQMTGRRVETRGVRLTGALYGAVGDTSHGWTVAVDARHQRMPDAAEALRGARSTNEDSRLSINGKLRF